MARLLMEICEKCGKAVYMDVEVCEVDGKWVEVHECPECGHDRIYEYEED